MPTSQSPRVLIIVGSESDRPRIEPAFGILEKANVPYEFVVSSAHRDPDKTMKLAREAAGRGVKVIIAGAGLSAALPGAVSSVTSLPVIGVPFAAGALNGLDALFAIAQLPSGVPVGTVGIDNAKNAANLALRILALIP
ncbi:MAG TPA: 5-(carboxyamino)imidazole ribonucleotide mutase [Gemmatimonadaceae bacterium]|jgi:phosphoribosylaminoimidazole carboxylase PurE protein|nr:5-(carboxyamino)imidazole ribonucleotide mutase [Gemmatimonadaceae bacterium]